MQDAAYALTRIRRVQVSRRVLDEISNYIDMNHLKPGDRLPGDREFVRALGVSRPLVQQALKVLEGLGRVTIVHGLGTFVADNGREVAAAELLRGVNKDRIAEKLLGTLKLLDREALRLAYECDRDGLLDALRARIDARERELAEDADDESCLGERFEGIFGRFSGNDVLQCLQETMHHAWIQAQLDGDWPQRNRFDLHAEHKEIYEALASGNLDLAESLLVAHLNRL